MRPRSTQPTLNMDFWGSLWPVWWSEKIYYFAKKYIFGRRWGGFLKTLLMRFFSKNPIFIMSSSKKLKISAQKIPHKISEYYFCLKDRMRHSDELSFIFYFSKYLTQNLQYICLKIMGGLLTPPQKIAGILRPEQDTWQVSNRLRNPDWASEVLWEAV